MICTKALALAVARLRAAGVDDAAGDARRLLSHALRVEPGRLTLHLADELEAEQNAAFEQLITARETRVPVSHLVGGRWFFDSWFIVTSDVLDPRPDTETLILQAIAEPFKTVLDLGLGTGCILLTLLKEKPLSIGVGTDISGAALKVAQNNKTALGLQDRATLVLSDWFQAVQGKFDLIVSNPPYITASEMRELSPEVREHEPHIALTPGEDGLDSYREIIAGARPHLNVGGRLIVEIGPKQAKAVTAMFNDAGFIGIFITQDLDGRDRVVQGENPPETM